MFPIIVKQYRTSVINASNWLLNSDYKENKDNLEFTVVVMVQDFKPRNQTIAQVKLFELIPKDSQNVPFSKKMCPFWESAPAPIFIFRQPCENVEISESAPF